MVSIINSRNCISQSPIIDNIESVSDVLCMHPLLLFCNIRNNIIIIIFI